MTKHTAGHWEVNESNRCVFSIIGGVYHSICRVSAPTKYADDGTSEANARLIAAAPELLNAFKGIVAFCDEDMQHRVQTSREYDIKTLAQAAIAKAEGEQA